MSNSYEKGSIGDIRNKARRRKKYADDEVYRQSRLEMVRRYRKEHPDRVKESRQKSYRKAHPLPTEEEKAAKKEQRRLKFNAYMREYMRKYKQRKQSEKEQ